MKKHIKVRLHHGEDRLLRENTRLAWLDGRQDGDMDRHIAVEVTDLGLTLVMYSGQKAIATMDPGNEQVWTERRLMESPYFLGMVEQLKLFAQQDLEKQAGRENNGLSAGSTEGDALIKQPHPTKPNKLVLGISVAALVASFVSVFIAFYALKVGLGAHVNAAASSLSASEQPAITTEMLAGLMGKGQKDAQTIGMESMMLMTEAAARTGFSLNERGQMVVMFSDPLCPACRQFESWIAKDKYQTFAPLMVPVAMQPGSREAAAAVLCSKNQGEKWAEIIAADPTATPSGVCEEGLRAIDRNNEIFSAMGLTHTPTFVAMNGRFLVGVKSPQEMKDWAAINDSAAP